MRYRYDPARTCGAAPPPWIRTPVIEKPVSSRPVPGWRRAHRNLSLPRTTSPVGLSKIDHSMITGPPRTGGPRNGPAVSWPSPPLGGVAFPGFGLHDKQRLNRNSTPSSFWTPVDWIICSLYSYPSNMPASFTHKRCKLITRIRRINNQQGLGFPASLDTKTFVTWQQALLKLAQMVRVFPYKLLK